MRERLGSRAGDEVQALLMGCCERGPGGGGEGERRSVGVGGVADEDGVSGGNFYAFAAVGA
jgi:hypothetical protein